MSRTITAFWLIALSSFLPLGLVLATAPTAVTRHVAPTGSDSNNDCATPSQPCATIVHAVQQTIAGDTVQIATGVYTETDVIRLFRDVTIVGAGLDKTRVTVVSGTHQIFQVYSGVTAAVSHLTLHGAARNGVSNLGRLTLDHVSILDNLGQVNGGGGIYNDGVLTMTNSIVGNNRSDNTAAGMLNFGRATIAQSLFINNEVGPTYYGGGLHNQGELSLANVTLAFNKGGASTAVSNSASGTITLTHVTIAHNERTHPEATTASAVTNYGIIRVRNSIIAHNGANEQCDGDNPFDSFGHNLESHDSCYFNQSDDQVHTDPLLLQTLTPTTGTPNWVSTIPFAAHSPARDAATADYCLPTDARGVARPHGSACDIGAYEFNVYRVLLPLVVR